MELKILDTGYIDNSSLGVQTQLSDANRAGYTGSAVSSITLKIRGITHATKSNTESKPIINTTTDSDASLVSTVNTILKITGILARTSTTSGWSTNKEYQISRIGRTRGLKLLYPTGVTDVDKTIVEVLGEVNINGSFADASPTDDAGTVSTTTPYLVGHVKNITFNDTAASKKWWTVTIDFEVSG